MEKHWASADSDQHHTSLPFNPSAYKLSSTQSLDSAWANRVRWPRDCPSPQAYESENVAQHGGSWTGGSCWSSVSVRELTTQSDSRYYRE
eukprot:705785-Amorphochlora_amoeboformis.AAC.1